MEEKLLRILTSIKTTVILILLFAAALAMATWIEKYHGSAAAREWIYHTPLVFLLQFLLVVNFICISLHHHLFTKKRAGYVLVHAAFVIILTGALTTFLSGEEGYVHLREGEETKVMMLTQKNGNTVKQLPFTIKLDDFILTRYPGSSSPSSYESKVTIYPEQQPSYQARIYMNNVLDVDGYRFFQASYDPDEQGSVLSVNHDVAGRFISYLGYLLLTIGLLLTLLMPGSRFSILKQELRKAMGCLLLMSILPCSATAQDEDFQAMVQRYTVPETQAERFSLIPMQSIRGRMKPINTFSSEVLRKLHKGNSVCGLNSDQFLMSLLIMPDVWIHIPFIAVPDKEVADRFGLPEDYCAYIQLFDGKEEYKLEHYLEEIYRKEPAQRTRFDKDVLKLDEQINIFHQLVNRQMLKFFPLPDDPEHRWYAPGDDLSAFSGMDSMFASRILDWYMEEAASALQSGNWNRADSVLIMIETYQQTKATTGVDISPRRMRTEVCYNRLRLFSHCKTGYLILGALTLLLAFYRMSGKKRTGTSPTLIPILAVSAILLFHTIGIGLRWYLAGYAPWSNSYETMVYVGWVTVVSGLCFARRNLTALALGTLFGGVILFVSELNWMDPQISPLVPVLKSPWLMFHVAVVVAAYGFFGLSCLMGLTNLLLMSLPHKDDESRSARIHELSLINEMSLWVGLSLMAVGIFLGAVWANESWGRYWGWDPKETWALITMLCYTVVTHLHRLPLKHEEWWLNWSSVISFSTVLMTFFGVNYLLSGMHSYGENPNTGKIMLPLIIVTAFIVLLSICSYHKMSRKQNKKVSMPEEQDNSKEHHQEKTHM